MQDEIILDEFAKRFSQLIKDNNTDIPTLAKNIGIKGLSTIYRYMSGSMSPKISTVKCIADIYNVNPAWLMGYNVPSSIKKQNTFNSDEAFFKGYKTLREDEKEALRSTLSVFMRNKGDK